MSDDGVYRTADLQMPSMAEVDALINEMKTVLRGRGPLAQGAALADIVAMYFAGHNPALREASMTCWIEAMRGLIEPNEKAILERYGTMPWDK